MNKGKKPEIATVIAPYQATSKEQLSLQRGQLIMIRKKTTSGWWEGETHVGLPFNQLNHLIVSASFTLVINELL